MNFQDSNTADHVTFYTITPKEDCPHEGSLQYDKISDQLTNVKIKAPCQDCNTKNENWMCLVCYNVFCSRYVNAHMSEHNTNTGHHIAFSFTDGSFWCYSCSSYINSKDLHNIAIQFSEIKFPESTGDTLKPDVVAEKLVRDD